MTGDTSTPPIGGTIFLVNIKIGSVGHAIKIQNPFSRSTLGYQVSTILNKKHSVKADSKKANKGCRIGRTFKKKDVTNLKASIETSYKHADHP